jgi:hypothetical protein
MVRIAAAVASLLAALAIACGSSNNTPPVSTGGSPSGGAQSSTAPIDGIPCESSERLTYHVHAHLAIIANGQSVPVPANIGIVDKKCIYWLHTHDASGVIHIEAPQPRQFTLGEFFDIWHQPLSTTQVAAFTADAQHSFQFFVDGKQYTGDPRQIPLAAHTLITIEYGPPFTPPPSYTFPPGL